jgi:hypothetical protein
MVSCPPQATEAETKEDREIICEEVFCDITGQLDFAAKGGLADSTACQVWLGTASLGMWSWVSCVPHSNHATD